MAKLGTGRAVIACEANVSREAAVEFQSSVAIRAIDYDRSRKRLRITFVSGERYAYERVPGEVHLAFLAADSKGCFFLAEVRGRYDFTRLA